MERTTSIVPSATLGVYLAGWANSQAGDYEDGKPTLKHAAFIWLAARYLAPTLGGMFGGDSQALYAQISCLGMGGAMFARHYLFEDSKWMKENVHLGDASYAVPDYSRGADLNGFTAQSALGDSFVDATGNKYVMTARGWALAGVGAELVQDDEGNVYQLGAGSYQYPQNYDAMMYDAGVGGFESTSALGMARRRSSEHSSFGYA